MAQVKYVGEGKSDPPVMAMAGYTFTLGESLEVNDPKALANMATNRHFEVSGIEKQTVEVPIVQAATHAKDDRDAVVAAGGKTAVPDRPKTPLTAVQQADFEEERGVRIPPWQEESQNMQEVRRDDAAAGRPRRDNASNTGREGAVVGRDPNAAAKGQLDNPDFNTMTKAELSEYIAARGGNAPASMTRDDMIAEAKKVARKA